MEVLEDIAIFHQEGHLRRTICHFETAEKSQSKERFPIPAMPDFLKSRPFHLSINFSGHNYLIFQDDLNLFSPIPRRLTGYR